MVGYGPHRTIYLTGIDANGKVAEGFREQAVQGFELTGPLRPYGSAHFGPGWPWIPIAPIDTREEQAWLGYKNIQHTVRYTELSPDRFRDFWRD